MFAERGSLGWEVGGETFGEAQSQHWEPLLTSWDARCSGSRNVEQREANKKTRIPQRKTGQPISPEETAILNGSMEEKAKYRGGGTLKKSVSY